MTRWKSKEINKILRGRWTLFRKGLNQAPLRCFVSDEVTTILKEVHFGDCGEHQRDSRLFKKILQLGYYWPTMEADSLSFARKCQAFQLLRNQTLAQVVELYSLSMPWPFHTWTFDLVGFITHLHEDSTRSSLLQSVTLSGSQRLL